MAGAFLEYSVPQALQLSAPVQVPTTCLSFKKTFVRFDLLQQNMAMIATKVSASVMAPAQISSKYYFGYFGAMAH